MHHLIEGKDEMKIYLVQHGESEPKTVDPARPLTAQGRQDVQQVAMFAARLGLEVEQIRHSGKTRAEQTAGILGEALSPAGGVVTISGLAPNDDVRPVAEALARESQPVMLVGHLPFLARLAGLLVTGNPDRSVVRFRNAGIVCLAREEDHWLVAWIITPEMAGT
jgi:phosphohistidine phosphatase